jgi:hypothetical protein
MHVHLLSRQPNGANHARCKASRELAGWGADFMIIVSLTF